MVLSNVIDDITISCCSFVFGQSHAKVSACFTNVSSLAVAAFDLAYCSLSVHPDNHTQPHYDRVRKYAKFGVFCAKIVQTTPPRLQRESLPLQKFSVTNSEPLRLQRVNYDQSLLDDRHYGFELSGSADRHSYFVYPSR